MVKWVVFLMMIFTLAFAASLQAEEVGSASEDEVAFAYDPHGARDPFLPLVTSAGAIITYDTNLVVSEMALEGIMEDGGGRVAVINGNIIESGQSIGPYKVERIDPDCVILLKDGQTSLLQLKKEE